MPHLRELNIANAAERMATEFAVGVTGFVASLVEEFSCVPSVASEQRSSGWTSQATVSITDNLITL